MLAFTLLKNPAYIGVYLFIGDRMSLSGVLRNKSGT